MPRNDRIKGHSVASHERVDVRTAESYIMKAEEYFAIGQ
jgi:hypothetical protein